MVDKGAYYDDSVLQRKIKQIIKRFGQTGRILQNIGRAAERDITQHFIDEEGPSGKWKRTSQATLDRRKKRKKPTSKFPDKTLSDTGKMRQIVATPDPAPNGAKKILVGTTAEYGKKHQKGEGVPKREWAYISNEGSLRMLDSLKETTIEMMNESGFKKI